LSYAALALLFLIAFAGVVWFAGTQSSLAFGAMVVPMVMLRLIPMGRAAMERRLRQNIASDLSRRELACSVCETRIALGRDDACPTCGSMLTTAQHRARWGI
jgi:hypothetical protein